MINSIDFQVLYLILWGFLGALVGTGLTKWINSSINGNPNGHNKNFFFFSILAFSAIRVAIAGAFMFFAFYQGLYSGLAFLAAFLITRWVWLFQIMKQQQVKG